MLRALPRLYRDRIFREMTFMSVSGSFFSRLAEDTEACYPHRRELDDSHSPLRHVASCAGHGLEGLQRAQGRQPLLPHGTEAT
jgi:hypothetical protein